MTQIQNIALDKERNRGMTFNKRHYYYYYYNRFMALWILSGTTRVSQYQKGKTKTNDTQGHYNCCNL